IEETGNKGMVPFLFQGQYYDRETGLAYNRFRYYSPKMGMYVSQDPIGLDGGILNLYGYVDDTNVWIDILGLSKQSYSQQQGINKAKDDLRRNGFDIIGEEITMKVNGSRIRADIIAKDGHGKTHIFEVKHKKGRLTKNQKKSGVYSMSSQSNTTTHLGGGTIKVSQGTSGTYTIDTGSELGKVLGGRGTSDTAVFHVLIYN
ncbi:MULTISPECIES: RHS repeat-associated core domain-containing protein, partial [Bacteroidaceae]